MAKKLFQPGNPGGGRKKIPPDIKKAFAAACPEAVETLIDLMRNGEDENIRLKAAIEITNRHLGKPVQPIGNDGDMPLKICVVRSEQEYNAWKDKKCQSST